MTTPIKKPSRLAIERAIDWGIAFTALDVQQYAQMDERRALQYLTALVSQGVLVRSGSQYRAGPRAQEWMRTPPKTRLGGCDAAYLARKAVLDRWRQAAWAEGRRVTDADPTPAPGPIIVYSSSEIAAMFGTTDRNVRYWIKRGHIRATKINDSFRVTHAEITRFLEGRKP